MNEEETNQSPTLVDPRDIKLLSIDLNHDEDDDSPWYEVNVAYQGAYFVGGSTDSFQNAFSRAMARLSTAAHNPFSGAVTGCLLICPMEIRLDRLEHELGYQTIRISYRGYSFSASNKKATSYSCRDLFASIMDYLAVQEIV